jgi:hypothetical protein
MSKHFRRFQFFFMCYIGAELTGILGWLPEHELIDHFLVSLCPSRCTFTKASISQPIKQSDFTDVVRLALTSKADFTNSKVFSVEDLRV